MASPDDCDLILKAPIRKDPAAGNVAAAGAHEENVFSAASDDFDASIAPYMFMENPVVTLNSLAERDN